MFIKDIQNKVITVGDYIAYSTDGHGSNPNLGIARVDLIRWFEKGNDSRRERPKVRCHIIKHSGGVLPGTTVWLERFDRMVKLA